jgi:hypothetical protein
MITKQFSIIAWKRALRAAGKPTHHYGNFFDNDAGSVRFEFVRTGYGEPRDRWTITVTYDAGADLYDVQIAEVIDGATVEHPLHRGIDCDQLNYNASIFATERC